MKKIAYYGGSFDPPHNGHLAIAMELSGIFELDEFVFIPAFHAPHKRDKKPTSAFHRFAMLSLATGNEPAIKTSPLELDLPEKPYTIETLGRLKEIHSRDMLFFVMGADSWQDIATWKEWKNVLTSVNIIVVTRPGYEIGFGHIPAEIRAKIIDLREGRGRQEGGSGLSIYITDAVMLGISSSEIRAMIGSGKPQWKNFVPAEVAKYIEKYDIY